MMPIRPFISLIIIFCFLFGAAFIKMEVRRMGYVVYKSSQDLDNLRNEVRVLKTKLAQLTQPSHLKKIGQSRLTLRVGQSNQYVHLALINSAKLKSLE